MEVSSAHALWLAQYGRLNHSGTVSRSLLYICGLFTLSFAYQLTRLLHKYLGYLKFLLVTVTIQRLASSALHNKSNDLYQVRHRVTLET